jgi:hypothetical protein
VLDRSSLTMMRGKRILMLERTCKRAVRPRARRRRSIEEKKVNKWLRHGDGKRVATRGISAQIAGIGLRRTTMSARPSRVANFATNAWPNAVEGNAVRVRKREH